MIDFQFKVLTISEAISLFYQPPDFVVKSLHLGIADVAKCPPVKYLRSSAVWNREKNEMVIFAINRSEEELNFTAELDKFEVDSLIEAREMHNADLNAKNNAEQESVCSKPIPSENTAINGNILSAKLKGYSWNMFRVKLQNNAR